MEHLLVNSTSRSGSAATTYLESVLHKKDMESKCAKTMRIASCLFFGLLGYICEYPTIKLSGLLSGVSALFSFGSFNLHSIHSFFENYRKGIFEDPTEKNYHSSCLKVFFLTTTFFFAISSRLPSAGLALKVVPGIPDNQRPWWAMMGLLGTFWPEALSGWSFFMDGLRHYKDSTLSSSDRKELSALKKRLLASLQAKQFEILSKKLSHDISSEDFLSTGRIEHVFETILKQQQLDLNKTCLRKSISLLSSTLTGTALLIENIVLTKFAIDSFLTRGVVGKYALATAFLFPFTHLLYSATYQVTYNSLSKFSRIFGKNLSEMGFAEKHFPFLTKMTAVFSLYWAASLYNVMKAEANAVISTETALGRMFFGVTYAGIFLLVYNSMSALLEKGIEKIGSRYNDKINIIYEDYAKLEAFKKTVSTSTLKGLARILEESGATIHLDQPSQKAIQSALQTRIVP